MKSVLLKINKTLQVFFKKKRLVSGLRILKSIISPVILFLVFIFIGNYVKTHWQYLATLFKNPNYLNLCGAMILFLVYFVLRVSGFKVLINASGKKISYRNIFVIWVLSEAARYVPGNIWSVVSRADGLKKNGFSYSFGVSNWIWESILICAASLNAAIFCIGYAKYGWIAAVFGVAIFFAVTVGIWRMFARRFKKLKKSELMIIKCLIVYSIGWLAFGFGNMLIVGAFINLSGNNMFLTAGYFVMAWLVGYLAIVTPMGLGVREGSFILLSSSLFDSSFSSFVSIAARVWLVLAEIVLIIIALIMKFLKNK